jgi:cytochrome b subunit of formate dehydrogenase
VEEHDCIHENWWGELKSDITRIKTDVNSIRNQLNGKEGVITKTELNASSIKRAWGWLIAVSLAILSIAGWVIKKSI